MILEKKIVKLSCLLLLAGILAGCTETGNETTGPETIMLSVDKNRLKSDGNDEVTFAVSADGNDISAEAKLFYKTADSMPFELSGKSFSTNIPGEYLFYATYDHLTSQEIQIEALAAVLVFSADNTIIKADGNSYVTFMLTADDEDVSDRAEIFLKNEDADVLLESNIFMPDRDGTYEFYCIFNNRHSDVITITAVPFVLSLRSDTSSFKSNGKESITFSVLEDENDITDEAEIFMITVDGDVPVENHSFSTLQEGRYVFFARYLYQTSDTVEIEAVAPTLTLSSDETDIKTGETVTFTIVADGVLDVSNDATLHITYNDLTTTVNGPTFTPSAKGVYSVHATCDGTVSNAVEITVSPKTISLTVDRASIKSTGADMATFTVYIDNRIDDADIYLMNAEGGDTKISDGKFSSSLTGSYSFYATFDNLKSNVVTVYVSFVNFTRQTCAMGFVATWCGFSPEMIQAFHEIRNLYPDQIQVISIHRTNSSLASTDIVAEEFLNEKEIIYTPYGIMDFRSNLDRVTSRIYQTHRSIVQRFATRSGIAITSQIVDGDIRVTLRVKVNETNEYSVGAIIVEDGVPTRQVVYYNNSHDNYEWKDNYISHSIATYIMPGTKIQTGKSLGTLRPGQEVTESFSIPANKQVTSGGRIVNHANCRVVAYVFRKEEGDKFFINNVATCPVNGSVDYKYEQ